MNILSVDWDYFFPSVSDYDWGCNENHGPQILNLLWIVRAYEKNIFGKSDKFAIDNVVPYPNCNKFWDVVLKNSDMKEPPIIITESHFDILSILNLIEIPNNLIWNFDQHHDCGYTNKEVPDCSNWGLIGKREGHIRYFYQIYPEWRIYAQEKIPFNVVDTVHYKIPSILPKFDLIFLCRSPHWTPPWCDKQWLSFIEVLQYKYHISWERKLSIVGSLSKRPFDISQAKAHHEAIKKMRRNK